MNTRIHTHCHTGTRTGFTLIEALAVVAVLAALTMILMPMFTQRRERRGVCGSNLKQIGLAIEQYAQDYDERYPRTAVVNLSGSVGTNSLQSWRQAIFPYVKSGAIFRCTLSEEDRGGLCIVDGFPQSYDVTDCGPIRVDRVVTQYSVPSPADTILVFEERGYTPQAQQIGVLWDHDSGEAGWTNILYAGHFGRSTYLFSDGHIQSRQPLQTIADGVNHWHVNTHDPVSPRAMAKLTAAEKSYGNQN